MVLEVSVHGNLALLLLDLWKHSISWWEHMTEETAYHMTKKEKEGLGS
jgi:hypothetical protein